MQNDTPGGCTPVSGFGSVGDVPSLPDGFTKVFASYLVDIGEIRLHTVIGGNGPPLLLLGGWPQNWFAWRNLMLPLSEQFTVIAADPRGVGLSDKPGSGYDADTLSADMFALMDMLGHDRFAMAGHDIGMWTGYAMAADCPDRIARIALGEAIIPGISPSPPLLSDDRRTSDFLWHFNFNRRSASTKNWCGDARRSTLATSSRPRRAHPTAFLPMRATFTSSSSDAIPRHCARASIFTGRSICRSHNIAGAWRQK